LVVLLAGEKELAQGNAETMAECLRTVPWETLCLASALCPAVSVHARGVEMGLWDPELLLRPAEAVAPESLVSRYLADDFDSRNPTLAGHTNPPPGKEPPPPEEKPDPDGGRERNRRRRRRRRR
jgi:hypothetical protein